MSKKLTIDAYKKITGTLPPIVVGIPDNMQETVQLIIMESFLDGYWKGRVDGCQDGILKRKIDEIRNKK